ncbi:methylphosphotriester-DNA--protein-cysteine methyltransferase family protein [Paenibacillus albiflavus]|uniref:Methylphosphotriester-DNA--protein-cysteine methyltransferase family protein n=2 Tax=Paenibacillus albiflavus TaxID=2545760 RepID=A0A4V2WQ43_9BACL|nr:Ada metal-binding domain-containing protein [Paenibacillus albiflavus]TCZ81312.1 methylphosphotriester-DNA--protein-cysteine methyltransferase family protein [Paenibacillus albiflavus]
MIMINDTQLSFDEMWDIILACDSSYDGLFFTAVKTTRIYCRPSCKSRKPHKHNVEFYLQINEAENAGYRACKRCQPNVHLTPQAELVSDTMAYLLHNYKQKLLLQDIATHVGISAYYLERLFKQHTTLTPRAYLEKIRVDKAAHLLRNSDLTNLEIAYEAGFQSPSIFYKAFRTLKQCSPSEYREQIGGIS